MEKIINSVKLWSERRIAGIFIFNLIVVVMVLLNTAQYFKPFFYLGINAIFFISMILATILLGARTKSMFTISLFFLLIASLLKIVGITVWADRASIYFYQAFLLGLLFLFIEGFTTYNSFLRKRRYGKN